MFDLKLVESYYNKIDSKIQYIKEKINHFFGYDAVSKILIQQNGPYDFTNDEK